MSNQGLMYISIGVLFIIIIGAIVIYEMQLRENSIYNKVTELIENYNIRRIIDIVAILTLVTISFLLVGLELSMFLPDVEWGWLERSTLVTTFATILGGFFGFMSAAIGIIGTYGAFYLGANKEKEKELEFKRTMLFNLLEFSMDRTLKIVKELNDLSINYGKSIYKDEDKYVCEKIRGIMEKISKNEYDQRFRVAIIAIIAGGEEGISTLPKNKYGYRLQDEFKSLIEEEITNLTTIIYDENWTSYLNCLKNSKDIQNVINWLNLLRSNANGYDVIDFLCHRNNIIKIIDENEPNVKEGSIRGSLERGRMVSEKYGLEDWN